MIYINDKIQTQKGEETTLLLCNNLAFKFYRIIVEKTENEKLFPLLYKLGLYEALFWERERESIEKK